MSRAAITLAATDETAGAFAAVKARLAGVGAEASALTARFAGVAGGITALLGGVSLGAYFKQITDGIDSLNDLKDATGSSIGNLSALEDIAARTGTSFETVSGALVKFNGALSGAKAGTEAAEVFKRLGLNVAELKAQDPAEAFRQVAVALKGFADDGDKARAVQVLFGRSLREVAPLLNDVAEAGRLNAKVTDEQAKQAEKFNQQLAALGKNATDAARGLVSELLPGLNKTAAALASLSALRGLDLTTVFGEVLKGNTFSDAADGVAFYSSKLAGLRQQYKLVAESSSGVARRGALIDLAKDIEDAEKLETYYRRIYKLTAQDLGQSDPAELARRGRGQSTRSIGDITGGDKVKQQVSEFEKYIDKLRAGLLATQQLTAEEQTRIDINRGLLGVLTEGQKQQALALAGALDSTRAQQDAARAYAALQAEGVRVTEGLRTEQEKLADATDRVEVLAAAGIVTWQTYARQVTVGMAEAVKATEQLVASLPKLSGTINAVSGETKALAADLNAALGDSIAQALDGSSRRIEDIWKNLIKRLAAQAIQAQLFKALFGEGYGTTTNQLGGLLGFLGSLGGGARASGGPVYAGRPYLVGERGPEVVVPSGNGTVLPNGVMPAAASAPAAVYNINVQGDASANTVRLINAALAQYEARRMRMAGA